MEKDAAHYHLWHSREYGGWKFRFPVVRGEAGMVPHDASTDDKTGLGIQKDLSGVWYHNYLWSSIDSGALYEIYWYADPHVYSRDLYDHRHAALSLYNFLSGIPLNNGRYRDLDAEVSNADLRVVGQKDPASGNAHLWIQNRNYTWKNAVDGIFVPAVSGTVRIGGFGSNAEYTLEWWDTRRVTGQQIKTETLKATPGGALEILIQSLTQDIALKIQPASGARPAPPQNVRIR
jgi:hypothetical protein